MTYRTSFPALWQFLAGVFYQSWDHNYRTVEEAVADNWPHMTFIEKEAMKRELLEFIDVAKASLEPGELLLNMNCFYDPTPDGISVVQWLEHLGRLLK